MADGSYRSIHPWELSIRVIARRVYESWLVIGYSWFLALSTFSGLCRCVHFAYFQGPFFVFAEFIFFGQLLAKATAS